MHSGASPDGSAAYNGARPRRKLPVGARGCAEAVVISPSLLLLLLPLLICLCIPVALTVPSPPLR